MSIQIKHTLSILFNKYNYESNHNYSCTVQVNILVKLNQQKEWIL